MATDYRVGVIIDPKTGKGRRVVIRDFKKAGDAAEKAANRTESYHKALDKIAKRAKMAAAALAFVAAATAIGTIAKSVSAYASFEQGLRNVQAVSNATAAELRELEEAALAAAAATKFDTTQATQGLYALASAGFSVKEQIAGLKPVLDLAAATAGDLGSAAEQVVMALRGFQLEATEAGRVADVLTASTQFSALNAERLTGALQNSAAISNAYGQSLEGTTAALAVLTTALSDGNVAGTALSGSWIQMTDKARQAGVVIHDTATGKILPLVEIIRNFEEANIDAQQAMDLFGARGGKAMSILLAAGSEALEEMEAKLQANGQAAEVAGRQMDTLQGDILVLRSVFDVLMVTLGKETSAGLRGVVQDLTSGIRSLTDWVRDNAAEIRETMTTAWDALSTVLSTAGKVIKFVATKLDDLAIAIAAVGTAYVATRIIALTTELTAAVGGLGSATLILHGAMLRLQGLAIVRWLKSVHPAVLAVAASATTLYNAFKNEASELDDANRALEEYGDTIGGAMRLMQDFTHRLSDEQIPGLREQAEELLRVNAAMKLTLDTERELLEGKKIQGYTSLGIPILDPDVLRKLEDIDGAMEDLEDEGEALNRVLEIMTTARNRHLNVIEDETAALEDQLVVHQEAIDLTNQGTGAIMLLTEAGRDHAASQEELERRQDALKDSYGHTRLTMEQYYSIMRQLQQAEAMGVISADDLAAAQERLQKVLAEDTPAKAAEGIEAVHDLWIEFGKRVMSAWADAIYRMMDEGLKSFKSFFSEVFDLFKRMIAEMIAYAIANQIILGVGFGGGMGGGAMGGATGGLMQGLMGAGGASLFSAAGFKAGLGGVYGGGFSNTMGFALQAAWPVLAIAAIYFAADWLMDRQKKKRTIGTLSFGIDEGVASGQAISGKDEVQQALHQGYEAISDFIEGFERLTGLVVDKMPEIEINVKGTGKIYANVAGTTIGVFEDINEAIAAAVTAAMSMAELSGEHAEVIQSVLQRSRGLSLEEVMANVAFAMELLRGPMSQLEIDAGSVRYAIEELLAKMKELGIDVEYGAAAIERLTETIRNEILGIEVDTELADRLAAGKAFNDSLQGLIDDTLTKMDELQAEIERRRALGDIGPGEMGVREGLEEFGVTEADAYQATGMTIEQLEQEFADLQALLDALPELIDLEGLAERLIGEFSGIDYSILNVQASAALLREEIEGLGLGADKTAALIEQLDQALALREQQFVNSAISNFLDLWERSGVMQAELSQEMAKLKQAEFIIELEMAKLQLQTLYQMGLISEAMLNNFLKAADAIGAWASDVGNFMVQSVGEVGGIGKVGRVGGGRRGRKKQKQQERERLDEMLRSYEMDAFSFRLWQLNKQFDEAAKTAKRLGMSEARVEAARRKAIQQLKEEYWAPLLDLRKQLVAGGKSTDAPLKRLDTAEREFTKALRSNDPSKIAEAAQQYLQTAENLFGPSRRYDMIRQQVLQRVEGILGAQGLIDPKDKQYNELKRQTDVLEQIRYLLGGEAPAGEGSNLGRGAENEALRNLASQVRDSNNLVDLAEYRRKRELEELKRAINESGERRDKKQADIYVAQEEGNELLQQISNDIRGIRTDAREPVAADDRGRKVGKL